MTEPESTAATPDEIEEARAEVRRCLEIAFPCAPAPARAAPLAGPAKGAGQRNRVIRVEIRPAATKETQP